MNNIGRGSFIKKCLGVSVLPALTLPTLTDRDPLEFEEFIPNNTSGDNGTILHLHPKGREAKDTLQFKQAEDGSWWIARDGVHKKLI